MFRSGEALKRSGCGSSDVEIMDCGESGYHELRQAVWTGEFVGGWGGGG